MCPLPYPGDTSRVRLWAPFAEARAQEQSVGRERLELKGAGLISAFHFQ